MKDIFAIIISIIAIIDTFFAIGLTNVGKFDSVSICIIILFICCFCIYVIAKANDAEEKKEGSQK